MSRADLTWHSPVCASPHQESHLCLQSSDQEVDRCQCCQDDDPGVFFRPNLAASDVNAVSGGYRGQDGCPGDGDSDHPGHYTVTGNSR